MPVTAGNDLARLVDVDVPAVHVDGVPVLIAATATEHDVAPHDADDVIRWSDPLLCRRFGRLIW